MILDSVTPCSFFIAKYGRPSAPQAELVDRRDGGVLEAALDQGLAHEAADRALARVALARMRLIATSAADLLVVGGDHLAHAARADVTDVAVAIVGDDAPRSTVATRALGGADDDGVARLGRRDLGWAPGSGRCRSIRPGCPRTSVARMLLLNRVIVVTGASRGIGEGDRARVCRRRRERRDREAASRPTSTRPPPRSRRTGYSRSRVTPARPTRSTP